MMFWANQIDIRFKFEEMLVWNIYLCLFVLRLHGKNAEVRPTFNDVPNISWERVDVYRLTGLSLRYRYSRFVAAIT